MEEEKDDLIQKKNNTMQEIEDLVQRKDHIIQKKNNAMQEIEALMQSKKDIERDKRNLNRIKGVLRRQRENLQAEINSKVVQFCKMGFRLSIKSKEVQKTTVDLNFKELALGAYEYLNTELSLSYEKHIPKEFLGAVFTNQIIILWGEPGTGKSSLPPAIAKYIDAKCHMISVQPSWRDNQDLLGFYNPVDKRYVSTPFLDILVDAKDNLDKIYIVCLDEMNLAQIEYYFSEILSAMETEDKTLRVYSPYIFNNKQAELIHSIEPYCPDFSKLDETEQTQWLEDKKQDESFFKLRREWEDLHRYPAEFRLPDNVQFVGTLNMDESTKNLSPKVLDRSYIIEVQKKGEDTEELSSQEHMESTENDMQELLKAIKTSNLSFSYSPRAEKQIKAMLERELTIDDILLGKILPTMKSYDFEDFNTLHEQLDEKKYPLSRKKAEKMYDKELKELNYWR